jgi:hypothetical protein
VRLGIGSLSKIQAGSIRINRGLNRGEQRDRDGNSHRLRAAQAMVRRPSRNGALAAAGRTSARTCTRRRARASWRAGIAAALTVPARVLLFCLASCTDWL